MNNRRVAARMTQSIALASSKAQVRIREFSVAIILEKVEKESDDFSKRDLRRARLEVIFATNAWLILGRLFGVRND